MSVGATARDTIKLVEQIGFRYTGEKDGIGHLILKHDDTGETYTISAHPSDHRAHRNAVLAMERIAGKKTQRIVRRRSRKKNQIAGYTKTHQTETDRRWSDRIGVLLAEHKDLYLEFQIISMGGANNTEINRAMKIIRRMSEIEDFLNELRQPIPEHNLSNLPTNQEQ